MSFSEQQLIELPELLNPAKKYLRYKIKEEGLKNKINADFEDIHVILPMLNWSIQDNEYWMHVPFF